MRKMAQIFVAFPEKLNCNSGQNCTKFWQPSLEFSHHWKNSIFDQLNFIFFETDRHLKNPTFFTFLFNFNLIQEEPDMTPHTS